MKKEVFYYSPPPPPPPPLFLSPPPYISVYKNTLDFSFLSPFLDEVSKKRGERKNNCSNDAFLTFFFSFIYILKSRFLFLPLFLPPLLCCCEEREEIEEIFFVSLLFPFILYFSCALEEGKEDFWKEGEIFSFPKYFFSLDGNIVVILLLLPLSEERRREGRDRVPVHPLFFQWGGDAHHSPKKPATNFPFLCLCRRRKRVLTTPLSPFFLWRSSTS